MNNTLKHPFGEVSFEDELKILGPRYREYFFDHVPFNSECLEKQCYLVIGRRGAGKSSLANYFTFQDRLPSAACLDVDEPDVFGHVQQKVQDRIVQGKEQPGPQLAQKVALIWEALIWQLVFEKLREDTTHAELPALRKITFLPFGDANRVKRFVLDILKLLIKKITGDIQSNNLFDSAVDWLASGQINAAKTEVMHHLEQKPLIIAFDTLEHYDIEDESQMTTMAALIVAASRFNVEFADRGLHVKVFVTSEVFPKLQEVFVPNTLKHIKDEIHMHWRSKDLQRLLCWRFHRYLAEAGLLFPESKEEIDWEKPKIVRRAMWDPYFGKTMRNRCGVEEDSFDYLLRHTQNRPRQMITLCNAVADSAKRAGTFPRIKPEQVVSTVGEIEHRLAMEVVNSYSQVYPNVASIIDALDGIEPIFPGKTLDKYGPRSGGQWKKERYNSSSFRSLVAELGIVGRVVTKDEKSKIIRADFEYNLKTRLTLSIDTECVIHPMFYERLHVKREHTPKQWRIIPYSVEHEVTDDE